MKTNAILLISLVLNGGLFGSLVYLNKQISEQSCAPAPPLWSPDRAMLKEAQAGPGPRFGPEFETVLKDAIPGARPSMFDLETGLCVQEPDFETFNHNARACSSWIRGSGLDISGMTIPGEFAFCIAYYMATLPVSDDAWESARAGDVLACEELAGIKEPKRLCLMASEEPRTFYFRTHEGTVGILRIGGVSPTDKCIGIRYRLVAVDPELVTASK